MSLLIALFCGFVSATPAEDRIATQLSGFEDVPTDAELAKGIERNELERALIAISADPSRPLFVRARATALLGHFPSAATQARVKALLDDATVHPSIQLQALRASARFGRALSPALHRYLIHPDMHLREAAQSALEKGI